MYGSLASLAAHTQSSRKRCEFSVEAAEPLSVNAPPAMASVGQPTSPWISRGLFVALSAIEGVSSVRYLRVH